MDRIMSISSEPQTSSLLHLLSYVVVQHSENALEQENEESP